MKGLNLAFGTTQNSLIVSIQEVEISIAAGSTSGTFTLGTTVDKNKSTIDPLGNRKSGGASDGSTTDCRVELTDNNTVTAFVNSTDSVARIVRCVVTHWAAFAISGNVAHGTLTISSGSTTGVGVGRLIDPAEASREVTIYCGATNNTSGDAARISARFATVTSVTGVSNSVSGRRGVTVGTMIVGFCQWVFATGILVGDSRSVADIQVNNGETSHVTGFSPVTIMANTLCLSAGSYYGDGFASSETYGYQSDSNHWTVVRDTSTASLCIMRLYALEFLSKWVKGGKQAAQPTFTAGVFTKDTTLTAFNRSKTKLTYLGRTGPDSFANIEYTLVTVETTSTTNVRGKRETTYDFGMVPTYSFEEFEFV